jgi:hypothetical protein
LKQCWHKKYNFVAPSFWEIPPHGMFYWPLWCNSSWPWLPISLMSGPWLYSLSLWWCRSTMLLSVLQAISMC